MMLKAPTLSHYLSFKFCLISKWIVMMSPFWLYEFEWHNHSTHYFFKDYVIPKIVLRWSHLERDSCLMTWTYTCIWFVTCFMHPTITEVIKLYDFVSIWWNYRVFPLGFPWWKSTSRHNLGGKSANLSN